MSSKRRVRRWEPTNGFDSLEGRELMTAGGIIGLDGQYINKFDYKKLLAKRAAPPAPPADRRVELPLPQYGPDAKAIITLYGPGTLISNPTLTKGTSEYDKVNTHVDSTNGGLHILFNGTTSNSQIIGSLSGVPKDIHPNIIEIRDADVAPFDTTGVGTNQMGYVNLARFNLAPGGRVNFSAGVQRIFLNDIAHGTQLDLAALATAPTTSPQNPNGFNSTTTTSNSGSTAAANTTGQSTNSTTVNGITIITVPPTTTQLTVSNGQLTGVGGITEPGSLPSTKGNVKVVVQGVELIVRNVNGRSITSTPEPRLGKEYVAGVDSSANKLILFQIERNSSYAVTKANKVSETMVDRKNGDTSPLVGAAIGQYANSTLPIMGVKGAEQLVVVGYGSYVQAYSVLDGREVGWFQVDPSTGIKKIDGIGGSSGDIFLTDSTGGSSGTGLSQGFDLTASLDSHVGVKLGTALNVPNTFNTKGGTTGVAGISYLYNAGAGYFDAYSPLNTNAQLGIMKVNVSAADNLSVNSTVKVGGSIPWDSTAKYVMGSVDQNIILVKPNVLVSGGYQTQTLIDPDTLASTGNIAIQYDSNLTGLSESFTPQLFGASVIDIKGNLKTFSAVNTDNMLLNVNGIANYTRINQASNTEIIAHPVLHLAVSWKPNSNVNIISSSRPTNTTPGGKPRPGTRGGVQVVDGLPVLGPYVNPAQS